ncbi:Hypothetical protein EAG7_00936 [Klebsiella aerogenes]|nr:Hypothetical protein EAG7_00936 [Klebsiella aerogenes]
MSRLAVRIALLNFISALLVFMQTFMLMKSLLCRVFFA